MISLAESRQLTGKVLRKRLMVIVSDSGCANVLQVSKCGAANMLICLTSQAEGCTLELWNTHKGLLLKNFGRIVNEVKAQQQREQENGDQSGQQHAEEQPPPVAGGHHHCNDDSEESKGSRLSMSRAPPTSTTTNARQPALKSITALVASIKSELGLPPATSIFDTISMSRSSLELTVTDAITLKDMAIQVAQKLGIPITEEPQAGV